MGAVITSLDRYRTSRARRRPANRAPSSPTFFFDLASPYTYLAAERAERLFPGLRWRPVCSDGLQCSALTGDEDRDAVARRAALLGLPLTWPIDPPMRVLGAMRVASLAAQLGLGAEFVLATSRLAFCGGYSIDEPEILAEAAAAAGIPMSDMLNAAGDVRRDGPIEEAGRRLLAAGADRLPALRVARRLFCGEERLAEAAAARASA